MRYAFAHGIGRTILFLLLAADARDECFCHKHIRDLEILVVYDVVTDAAIRFIIARPDTMNCEEITDAPLCLHAQHMPGTCAPLWVCRRVHG